VKDRYAFHPKKWLKHQTFVQALGEKARVKKINREGDSIGFLSTDFADYTDYYQLKEKFLLTCRVFGYIEHHGVRRNFMVKTFGEMLRNVRINAGIGLRELARLIDKSPGYLSDVENGRAAPPSEEVLVHIARALSVDKQRLLIAARKVDPELSDYVAQQPQVAGFLRTAKDRGYEEEDWVRLAQLADIAKLGKGKGEK